MVRYRLTSIAASLRLSSLAATSARLGVMPSSMSRAGAGATLIVFESNDPIAWVCNRPPCWRSAAWHQITSSSELRSIYCCRRKLITMRSWRSSNIMLISSKARWARHKLQASVSATTALWLATRSVGVRRGKLAARAAAQRASAPGGCAAYRHGKKSRNYYHRAACGVTCCRHERHGVQPCAWRRRWRAADLGYPLGRYIMPRARMKNQK